jgi:hypothetical protein
MNPIPLGDDPIKPFQVISPHTPLPAREESTVKVNATKWTA